MACNISFLGEDLINRAAKIRRQASWTISCEYSPAIPSVEPVPEGPGNPPVSFGLLFSVVPKTERGDCVSSYGTDDILSLARQSDCLSSCQIHLFPCEAARSAVSISGDPAFTRMLCYQERGERGVLRSVHAAGDFEPADVGQSRLLAAKPIRCHGIKEQ